MDYSFLQFLTLLGAVGVFLYGMKVMSEGLQKVAGDRLRNIISLMTRNRFFGVLTGVLITVLVQSSSASTVMVVSFVNAGLMTLAQSMAVIFGANLGTTATSWLIAVGSFKFNIYAFAVPIMAFAVPMLFSSKGSVKSLGEFLIGFALLFIGMEQISLSVPDLKSSPEIFAALQGYTQMGYWSYFLFLMVGLLVTMVVQSSAATFAVVLIMSSKGWIPFDMSCAIVLGACIGTTITPILASLSGNIAAKKAALGHLLFNIFGAVWLFVVFGPFVDLIAWITKQFGLADPTQLMAVSDQLQATEPQTYNNLMQGAGAGGSELGARFVALQFAVSFGLSMFRTVYNIINLLIMIWFTDTYVKICDFVLRSRHKEDEEFQLVYIKGGLLQAAELNISQAEKEIIVYANRVDRMYDMVREFVTLKSGNDDYNKLFSRIGKYEEISDRMEIEIANYLNHTSEGRLSNESKLRISVLMSIVGEIESIADSCNNIAKTIVRKDEAHVEFIAQQYEAIDKMMGLVKEALTRMIENLSDIENITASDLVRNFNKEREINNFRNLMRNENIENINNHLYEYQSGIFYNRNIQLISYCGSCLLRPKHGGANDQIQIQVNRLICQSSGLVPPFFGQREIRGTANFIVHVPLSLAVACRKKTHNLPPDISFSSFE